MQDVEKELPGLIRELLQAPAAAQRALIERHYTPGCRLTHALVQAEDRSEIVGIFQAWRGINRRLDVDVQELLLDRGGAKVWVQLVQHVTGPLWAFSLPMHVLLTLQRGPGGAWLIAKQVDYHSFEGILYAAPLLGALLQHAFRPWNAALLVGGAAAAGRLWPRAQAALRAALGAATADRLVDRVARAWRRQTPRRPWRPLPAPYNPHL